MISLAIKDILAVIYFVGNERDYGPLMIILSPLVGRFTGSNKVIPQ